MATLHFKPYLLVCIIYQILDYSISRDISQFNLTEVYSSQERETQEKAVQSYYQRWKLFHPSRMNLYSFRIHFHSKEEEREKEGFY